MVRYFSRIGIPKASVFPEPVEAFPITQLPERICGIAADWIGVGLVNSRRASARSVGEERLREAQFGRATVWN